MQEILELYRSKFGEEPESLEAISGGGSSRRYFRLAGSEARCIGTIGNDVRENKAFATLSRAFSEAGVRVPRVLNMSEDGLAYLQDDLGECALFDVLGVRVGEDLVRAVMEDLPRIHTIDGFDDEMLYPVKRMEEKHLLRDLNYFKYCFLKALGVEPDEDRLDADFATLVEAFNRTPTCLDGLILRDCQSRNVMVHEGKPWYIDFQSARRGPVMYDVASFLWQAKARFSREFRMQMAETYIDALAKVRSIDKNEAFSSLRLMVWLRTLQVLGAYGLRGLTQRKAHFLQSIPPAMKNVRELLDTTDFEHLAELRRCLELAYTEIERRVSTPTSGTLRVEIFSFSYKKGYPDDFSGNGGGFMFDCRAMHNPGRYREYKHLTGLDRPVIDFLEDKGEVQTFVSEAYALTSPAVRRYLQRGFTNLQIGFGCTGGQHRSVYCAEHLANDLRESFKGEAVEITVTHREQQ